VHRVLVWGEGYLDGADSTVEMSLRRSQQLRNLYNAMDSSRAGVQPSSSEINTSTTPSAAPEDLTVMEWFYVGSMAVIFAPGDGYSSRKRKKPSLPCESVQEIGFECVFNSFDQKGWRFRLIQRF